jgi:broad specificity phosphatase PhoE
MVAVVWLTARKKKPAWLRTERTETDAFFARPEESVRGWERVVDAQARVAAAVDDILQGFSGESTGLVAHGGVGSLLLCNYLGIPTTRTADQPFLGHGHSTLRHAV